MKQKVVNFPVTLTGQWQRPNDENCSTLSVNLKSWLLDEGSLTARLKKHCNSFDVRVIGEEQQLCSKEDACDLIKVGEPVLVREVILFCDNIPQVFARSILPLTSLTGAEKVLANLGQQPLGQVLFNNPSLKRKRLELSSFSQDSSIGYLVTCLTCEINPALVTHEMTEDVWGRRSIFILENKPLMVAEVFLPSALAYR